MIFYANNNMLLIGLYASLERNKVMYQ